MIEHKTTHAAEARARLLEQFKDVPELVAILDASSAQTQADEDVSWQLLVERWLGSSVGVQLDGVGEIVGEGRLGRDDATYRVFLRARILINLSSGTGDEIIAIMELVCGMPVSFDETGTATLIVGGTAALEASVVAYAAILLKKAKVGGVKAYLTCFAVPPEEVFTFADGDEEQASIDQGFADDGRTIGGKWADVIDIGHGAQSYVYTPPATMITFAEVINPKALDLCDVAYGNGVWVAVGGVDSDAYILRSVDGGVTWSEIANPKGLLLFSVTYGNGVWIAVGSYDDDTYIIRSTDDGLTWTEIANPGTLNFLTVAYGNDVWIAVGWPIDTEAGLLRSIDAGLSWTLITGISNLVLPAVGYGNGVWVAFGDPDPSTGAPQLWRSLDDGATWTVVSDSLLPAWFGAQDIAYSNGVWIAVGYNDPAAIARSVDDGLTWTTPTNPQAIDIGCIVAGGDSDFIAAGASGLGHAYVLHSTDGGLTWIEILGLRDFEIIGSGYGDGVFVLVGADDGSDAYLLRSTT